MEFIEKVLEKGKHLAKSKEAKSALKILEKHRDLFDELGEDYSRLILGRLGLGEREESLSLLGIFSKSPDDLIDATAASGERMKEAHRIAMERAEKQKAMIKDLAGDAGRFALALVISAI